LKWLLTLFEPKGELDQRVSQGAGVHGYSGYVLESELAKR